MSEYTVKGRDIFSDRGKVVATITDDGGIVMAPGMAGAHKRAVEEFLARGAKEPPPPMPPFAEATEDRPEIEEADTAPETPKAEEKAEQSREEFLIETIPDDRLPPFSKALGVNTPGFAEFVEKNHLSAAQVAALVKRLERR